MSDAVLAAIIAATATLCASFMQLRIALAREADARSRGQPISRRRSRLPMILLGIMLLASAVGGFALSQWLGGSQRSAQADLQRELRQRIAELAAAVTALERLNSAAAAAGTPVIPVAPPAAASGAADAPPPGADAAQPATAAAATPAFVAQPAAAPAAAAPLADARPVVAQGPLSTHTP